MSAIWWPMCTCRDGKDRPPCPRCELVDEGRLKELDDILSEEFTQLQPRDVWHLRCAIMQLKWARDLHERQIRESGNENGACAGDHLSNILNLGERGKAAVAT